MLLGLTFWPLKGLQRTLSQASCFLTIPLGVLSYNACLPKYASQEWKAYWVSNQKQKNNF